MNGIIVFFLSPDNDKLAEPIEYYVENNKTLSFKGIQSTDASIQYLLWKAAHDEAPVNKIITIVSNEVKEKTWGDFQKRVKNWLSEEKLRKDYEGRRIEFLPIEYDEILDDTFKLAGNVYRQLSKYIFESDEKASVYLDYTGGFRDVSFLMVTIMRYLEYHEVPCKEVVYAHWKKPTRICSMNNIYEMFQLLNGVDQFTRTGNADLLWQCYRKTDNELIKKVLEKIVEFSQAMSLCDIRKIDTILFDLNNSLAAYAKEASTEGLFECVFGDMVKIIREKMKIKEGEELSYLQVISWCVDNNMLQQALVLYIEKMPKYYVEKGVFLKSIDDIVCQYRQKDIELFQDELKKLNGANRTVESINLEEIKNPVIKQAFKSLIDFVNTYYKDGRKKSTVGCIELYSKNNPIVVEDKNEKTLLTSIEKDNSKVHYFLYKNEEDYYYYKKGKGKGKEKPSARSFYLLNIMETEKFEEILIPNLMAVEVMKAYLVLKLIRNQVSHAGGGDGYEDDIYAQKLYENKYNIKMDTFEDVKALLQKGIEISKTAIEYVKQHTEIDK
ncbi:MAG: hypothetical protein ACLUT4_10620 [Lachnospiraceae bacterium]